VVRWRCNTRRPTVLPRRARLPPGATHLTSSFDVVERLFLFSVRAQCHCDVSGDIADQTQDISDQSRGTLSDRPHHEDLTIAGVSPCSQRPPAVTEVPLDEQCFKVSRDPLGGDFGAVRVPSPGVRSNFCRIPQPPVDPSGTFGRSPVHLARVGPQALSPWTPVTGAHHDAAELGPRVGVFHP
jgi:hypothetical protein